MGLPIILKDGAVSGPSTAGQGSNDLVAGERVDLSDIEPANVGSSYLWEFESVPIGTTPTIIDPATSTPHFFVDADPALAGSYRVKATVDGIEFSTEVFAKPLTNTGTRIPSFQEQEEYDESGNPLGWHESQTVFMRTVDVALGNSKASVTERQTSVTVALGNSTQEESLGGIVYPGSALAISGRLTDPVTGGSVEVRLKVNAVVKLTAVLNVGSPSFSFDTEVAGVHPLLSADDITVEIEGISYANAGASPSALDIVTSLSNDLTTTPFTVPDASNTVKGITKLSVAPAVPTQPVAVGTNDNRIPSQDENDALVGTNGIPSTANPYVTDSDPRNTDLRDIPNPYTPVGGILNITGDLGVSGDVIVGGQILGPDGTLGTPTHSFTDAPTMGMYRVGTNTLGFQVNSTMRMQIANNANRYQGVVANSTDFTGPNGASHSFRNATAYNASAAGNQAHLGLSDMTVSPSSGPTEFYAIAIAATINQSGSATGSYTMFYVDVIETNALGTANKFADWKVDGTPVFSVSSTGNIDAGDGTIAAPAYGFTSTVGVGMYVTGPTLVLAQSSQNRLLIGNVTNVYSSRITSIAGFAGHSLESSSILAATAGEQRGVDMIATFAPTSGTATFVGASIDSTINQTGGASGNTTGLRITTTGTAVVGTHLLIDAKYHATAPVTVFSVDSNGVILAGDGVVGAPAYSFLGLPDTGLYRVGTGVKFVVSAAERLSFDSVKNVFTGKVLTTEGLNTNGVGNLFKNAIFAGTSGDIQAIGQFQASFAPASGATDFYGLAITPIINQTGLASGDYTALHINVTETSVLGAGKLIDAGTLAGGSLFTVSNTGATNISGPLEVLGGSTIIGSEIRANVSGIGSAKTIGFNTQNGTAAAAGVQQWSPMIRLKGEGWKTDATAASQDVEFAWQVEPIQGAASPTGDLHLFSRINGGAGSWIDTMQISAVGDVFLVDEANIDTAVVGHTLNIGDTNADEVHIGRATTVGVTIGASLKLNGGTNTFTNGGNLKFGTSIGSMIGTATDELIGIWGATPVARPAAYTPTNVTTDRSFDAAADAHGSIYVDGGSTTQVTNATANTFDKITGFTTTGPSLQTTLSVAADTITVLKAGTYRIHFQCSFEGSASTHYEIKLYDSVGATAHAGFTLHHGIGSSNEHESVSLHGLLTLAANDVLEVRVAADASSKNFIPSDMNLTVETVGVGKELRDVVGTYIADMQTVGMVG